MIITNFATNYCNSFLFPFTLGDLGSGASKPSSGVSSIRPMYVLAIEEEEDERSLPKVLLKLAISEPVNKGGEQRQQSSSGEQNGISAGIEYILDAKMDDLAPVLHNFQVNKSTGELFLIRPLDRDPPNGKGQRFNSAQRLQCWPIFAHNNVCFFPSFFFFFFFSI